MKKFDPKILIGVIIAAVILVLLATSAYQVDKDEVAVIIRLGKHVRLETPGFHLKLPFNIEKNINVNIKQPKREEFGFITLKASAGKSEFYRGPEQVEEARMLTGDLKVIQVEWIVQYRVTDPFKYLFNVRNPRNSLRAFSIIAMSKATGDYLFDQIITIAKAEITNKMRQNLQEIIEKMEMGVTIQTVELINVTPPKEVEKAYNAVLQAQQERDRIINEAKQEYNKTVIPFKGKAERIISEAMGYKAERVKIAEGDAKYFNSLYTEYIKAPEVTKTRIYLETMSTILPKLDNVYVVDESQKNLVPLMQMGAKNFTSGSTTSKTGEEK